MVWEDIRDWEVVEAVYSLGKDSYDLVGRDIPVSEDIGVDFLRYRGQNHLIEARFYYDDENELDSIFEDIEDLREILMKEGFTTRISVNDVESVKPNYEPSLSGNYFLDTSADAETVSNALNSILEEDLDDLLKLKCKE